MTPTPIPIAFPRLSAALAALALAPFAAAGASPPRGWPQRRQKRAAGRLLVPQLGQSLAEASCGGWHWGQDLAETHRFLIGFWRKPHEVMPHLWIEGTFMCYQVS